MASATHNIEGATRLSDQDGAGGLVADRAAGIVENPDAWNGVRFDCSTPRTLNLTTRTVGRRTHHRVAISWTTDPSFSDYTRSPSADIDLEVSTPTASSSPRRPATTTPARSSSSTAGGAVPSPCGPSTTAATSPRSSDGPGKRRDAHARTALSRPRRRNGATPERTSSITAHNPGDRRDPHRRATNRTSPILRSRVTLTPSTFRLAVALFELMPDERHDAKSGVADPQRLGASLRFLPRGVTVQPLESLRRSGHRGSDLDRRCLAASKRARPRSGHCPDTSDSHRGRHQAQGRAGCNSTSPSPANDIEQGDHARWTRSGGQTVGPRAGPLSGRSRITLSDSRCCTCRG